MRNNIIKLVFVILISMVFCSFFQLPTFILNTLLYVEMLDYFPIAIICFDLGYIIFSLFVFVLGMLALFNKHKKIWIGLLIAVIVILIGMTVFLMIERIMGLTGGINPEALLYSKYQYVISLWQLIFRIFGYLLLLVFTILILKIKEGENKNEEECIEELC